MRGILFIDLIFLLLNMIYYLTTYLALLYTPLILYTTINLYCLTEKGKKFYAYIVGRSNTKDMFFAIQRYSLCIGTNFTYILFIIFIRNLSALSLTEPHACFDIYYQGYIKLSVSLSTTSYLTDNNPHVNCKHL